MAKRLKNATLKSPCGCQDETRVRVRPAFTTFAGSAARPAAYPQVRPPVHKSSVHMSADFAGGAGFSDHTETQAQRCRLPHTVRGTLAQVLAIKSCRR